MNKRFRFVLSLALLLMVHGSVFALPQFALLSGNRCINCHTTTEGGGQRGELGQYAMDGVGLVAPHYLLPGKTTFANGKLLLGGDFRVQMARSHVSPVADRRVFPMQAALYGVLRPSNAFKIEGAYNAGPKKFDGQRAWSLSAIYQPTFDWPLVRVGHFRPPIGMRYDDHTMLVHQTPDVIGAKSLIAPNYAEYGAEIHYYRKLWLSLTAGIYGARALAENSVIDAGGAVYPLIADRNQPSYLGRVVFWPKLIAQKLNFYLGGSVLQNDDFRLSNLFAGAGRQDRAALMLEAVFSNKEDIRNTRAVSLDVLVRPRSGLIVFARGEYGAGTRHSASASDVKLTTRQAVFGGQIFLTPQIEVRPEYRLLDTETFRSGRYALQLHVFY